MGIRGGPAECLRLALVRAGAGKAIRKRWCEVKLEGSLYCCRLHIRCTVSFVCHKVMKDDPHSSVTLGSKFFTMVQSGPGWSQECMINILHITLEHLFCATLRIFNVQKSAKCTDVNLQYFAEIR